MARKNRPVRHVSYVEGITVNGRPFGIPDQHACAICSGGSSPAWRQWEAAVECVTAQVASLPPRAKGKGKKGGRRRITTGWIADEGAMRALGLQ